MLDFTKLVLNTQEPVSAQIISFVKRQIFLGQAVKGETMPSRRELAAQLKINPNTAQKAFKALEETGLVLTPKNTVSILYFDENTIEDIKKEMTNDLVRGFVRRAKENRLTLEEIEQLLKEEWEGEVEI